MEFGKAIRRAFRRFSASLFTDESLDVFVKDIQRALVAGDVDLNLALEIGERIKKKAKKVVGFGRKDEVLRIAYEELKGVLGQPGRLELKKQRILIFGLYGSGKTTSAAKLAKYIRSRGLEVALVSADVQREAAIEQLRQLAQKANVPFFQFSGSPVEIASRARELEYDVVILDSSGRDALSPELLDELKGICEAFDPDLKLLVLSADLGQGARGQIEAFSSVGIDGVIITKMDTSAKGGAALIASREAKIFFLGTGEGLDDIEPFDPDRYLGRLLGVPDVESLVRKVEKVKDEVPLEKVMRGEFDFEVMLAQIRAAKKMGPLRKVIQMIGLTDLPEEAFLKGEERMKKFEAIICSMTKEERRNPDIINASRIRRIAKGAGVSEEDVKELLREYKRVEKLMKIFKSKRLLRGEFRHLFKFF